MDRANSTTYSLIICTYNQCASLQLVLECVSRQIVTDASLFEVIVVDNNSSDATRQVCETAQNDLPFAFRYIFENRQGLSVARNRGAREARGDILIYTDDDAKLPDNWLAQFVESYPRHDADCVFGKILIDWEKGKPDWYSDAYKYMFSALDYGETLMRVKSPYHDFYGKNFSLKKQLLLEVGGFDENLGRKGARLFVGEERKIYLKLLNKGSNIIYNPAIQVFHRLKDDEYSEEYFLRHYHDRTISEYRMMIEASGKRIFGRPAFPLRKVITYWAHHALALLRRRGAASREELFHQKLEWKKHWQIFSLWLRNTTDG